MVFKIRTSKKTMNIFEEISASTNYQPFILSKLSISMSVKSRKPLAETDFKTDNFGLELNRQTITGEWDDLYKGLIEMFEGNTSAMMTTSRGILRRIWIAVRN